MTAASVAPEFASTAGRGAPRPRHRLRNALLIVGVLLLAVIALQPLWLAPLIAHDLSRRSGRSVEIASAWVGLSSSLEPVVHFNGIRIQNAPWADTTRPFAVLASAAAVVSWRSIEQHRPVIALMVLRDGEVDLERQADGLRNWRLGNPENRGPGRYKVLALQVERARLRFRHAGIDLDFVATASDIVDADANVVGVASVAGGASGASGVSGVSPMPLPTRIELAGEWRQLPFRIDAATGPALTFLETGRDFGLRGFLEAGGARLDLDGRAGDIAREARIDARVALVASSLAPFAAFVQGGAPAAKALRVEGALKVDAGHYAIADAKARIGATDLAGDLSLTRREPRSLLRARLVSELTDSADLRWLAGVRVIRPTPAVAVTQAPAVVVRDALAEKSFDFTAARTHDAELGLVVRHLRVAAAPWLQSAKIDASLLDGRAAVSKLDLGVADGHAVGSATLDAHDTPLRAEADVRLQGVRVDRFGHDPAAKGKLTGALDGRVALKASGDSLAALRASASGTIEATLASGTISSLLDAEIGLQGGKIVRSLIGGAEPIAIRCGAANVDVASGNGRVRSFVLDTERTRTTATGTIDLGKETLDLVLTPEAKQGGLFILDRSIRLHGPLRHPERELVARVEVPAAAGRACPPARP